MIFWNISFKFLPYFPLFSIIQADSWLFASVTLQKTEACRTSSLYVQNFNQSHRKTESFPEELERVCGTKDLHEAIEREVSSLRLQKDLSCCRAERKSLGCFGAEPPTPTPPCCSQAYRKDATSLQQLRIDFLGWVGQDCKLKYLRGQPGYSNQWRALGG